MYNPIAPQGASLVPSKVKEGLPQALVLYQCFPRTESLARDLFNMSFWGLVFDSSPKRQEAKTRRWALGWMLASGLVYHSATVQSRMIPEDGIRFCNLETCTFVVWLDYRYGLDWEVDYEVSDLVLATPICRGPAMKEPKD